MEIHLLTLPQFEFRRNSLKVAEILQRTLIKIGAFSLRQTNDSIADPSLNERIICQQTGVGKVPFKLRLEIDLFRTAEQSTACAFPKLRIFVTTGIWQLSAPKLLPRDQQRVLVQRLAYDRVGKDSIARVDGAAGCEFQFYAEAVEEEPAVDEDIVESGEESVL